MASYNPFQLESSSVKPGEKITLLTKVDIAQQPVLPPKDPGIDRQQLQRAKFRLGMRTLQPFRPLIAELFGYGQKHYAQAMSLFLRTGVTGTYPDLQVYWLCFIFTKNNIVLPSIFKMKEDKNHEMLIITWDNEIHFNNRPDDRVDLLVLDSENNDLFCYRGLATRETGQLLLDTETLFEIPNRKIWLLFTQKRNNKLYSGSVYLGDGTPNQFPQVLEHPRSYRELIPPPY